MNEIKFDDLPLEIRENLLANNCEFAIYDELVFYKDESETYFLENIEYPEKEIMCKWNGSEWESFNFADLK